MSSDRSTIGAHEVESCLPAGRHGISPEKVIAHQRGRIIRAAAIELRRQGFAHLTVAAITSRARVSRRTFYGLFKDKLDCLLGAHQDAVGRLELRIKAAYGEPETWTEGLELAITALLEFAAEYPDQMYLILYFDITAPDLTAARFGLAVRKRLLLGIAQLRAAVGSPSVQLADEMAVGATLSVIASRLEAGEAERVPDWRDALVGLVLRFYRAEGEGLPELSAA